jgi:hypothetical protein
VDLFQINARFFPQKKMSTFRRSRPAVGGPLAETKLLESNGKHGEVRKDRVETGLSATSKMDSNKESASRRRRLS